MEEYNRKLLEGAATELGEHAEVLFAASKIRKIVKHDPGFTSGMSSSILADKIVWLAAVNTAAPETMVPVIHQAEQA